MGALEIGFCVGVIAIGVAVIAYILLRTPQKPASFGDVPSVELGEQPEAEGTEENAEATEETSE
jgi:hypothetical protein